MQFTTFLLMALVVVVSVQADPRRRRFTTSRPPSAISGATLGTTTTSISTTTTILTDPTLSPPPSTTPPPPPPSTTTTTTSTSDSTGPLGALGTAPSDFSAGDGIPEDYTLPPSINGQLSSSGSYIVKLASGASVSTIDSINGLLDNYNTRNGLPYARRVNRTWRNFRDQDSAVTDADNDAHPNRIRRKFLNGFKGISGKFQPTFLNELKQQFGDAIDYIEPDLKVDATLSQTGPPSWGLTRISNLALNLTKPYYYPSNPGSGVDIYILDTAVQTNHVDFGGRASMPASYVVNETNPTMDGHGTHVSGIAAGTTFGIAKNANIYNVQVLNNNRQGYYSWVISGINYVITQARPGKTVLNLSVSGGFSQAVNDAITAAFNAGIVVITAAGNSNLDACATSPASASGALVVGATASNDTMANFSNYGGCVDLFAPGVNIRSLWAMPGISNSATAYMSGTSQAAPHVAGIAALYMSMFSYSGPQAVYNDLTFAGNWNVLSGLPSGTVNVLAFNWQDPTLS